jgi:hypothetical protein
VKVAVAPWATAAACGCAVIRGAARTVSAAVPLGVLPPALLTTTWKSAPSSAGAVAGVV